jgi:hypothetical protein
MSPFFHLFFPGNLFKKGRRQWMAQRAFFLFPIPSIFLSPKGGDGFLKGKRERSSIPHISASFLVAWDVAYFDEGEGREYWDRINTNKYFFVGINKLISPSQIWHFYDFGVRAFKQKGQSTKNNQKQGGGRQ